MTNLSKTHLTRVIHQTQQGPKQRANELSQSFKMRDDTRKRKKPSTKKKDLMIYHRMVHSRQELAYSSGVRAKRENFDPKTGVIIGDPEGTAVLQMLKSNANQLFQQFRLTGQPIRLRHIKNALLGLTMSDPHAVRVSEAIEKFLAYQQERVDAGDIGAHTLQWKRRSNTLFLEYLKPTYSATVTLDEILPADAKKFMTKCKIQFKHTHNYTIKVISAVKEMLFFAVENKWIEHNPFTTLRNKKEVKMGDILTEKEVDQLLSINLFAPAMERVRDVFAWQLYTGLSYRDVLDLKHDHIMTTDKGERYIMKHRQKTGNPSIIPIIPQAELLLMKYASDEYCQRSGKLLPVISNQKMNNYLKQLAGMANIKKRLTSHVARRTCATIFINNGVPINTVAKVLGHSGSAMTERHYAQLQPETVIREIQGFVNRKAQ